MLDIVREVEHVPELVFCLEIVVIEKESPRKWECQISHLEHDFFTVLGICLERVNCLVSALKQMPS